MKNISIENPSKTPLTQTRQSYAAESVSLKMHYGSESIETSRLFSVLLGTDEPVSRLLAGLSEEIFDCTADELLAMGLKKRQIHQLQAAFELIQRIHQNPVKKPVIIRSPDDAANYKMHALRDLKQEHFVCLFLNTKNRVIGEKTVFTGTLNGCTVHPREVFREAVVRSAASIICLHNHPSGNPDPSREDIELTRRLRDVGNTVGIELLDHIVIGDGTFRSIKQQGLI